MFKTKFKIALLHDDMYHVFEKQWFQFKWYTTKLPGFVFFEEAEAWVSKKTSINK